MFPVQGKIQRNKRNKFTEITQPFVNILRQRRQVQRRQQRPQQQHKAHPSAQARVSCSLRVIHLWSPPIFLIFASPCPALWMSLMDAHFFHSLSCGHTLWRNRHSMTIMRQPQISTGAGENGNKSTKPSANPSFVLCADCLLSGKEGSFPVPRICHSKFSLNMV